jgi:hypothetical protein
MLGDKDGRGPSLAIEEALGDLARFSLIRLTPETVSVHRLLVLEFGPIIYSKCCT